MSNAMNFDSLVELCQRTHEEVGGRAARSVDAYLVVRNWLFGRYIVEYEQRGADRADYGASFLQYLARRLSPLGIKGTGSSSSASSTLRTGRLVRRCLTFPALCPR